MCIYTCRITGQYNEQEPQLWLIYVLNYLPFNQISFSFSNSSTILNILTKLNGGVYIAKGKKWTKNGDSSVGKNLIPCNSSVGKNVILCCEVREGDI